VIEMFININHRQHKRLIIAFPICHFWVLS